MKRSRGGILRLALLSLTTALSAVASPAVLAQDETAAGTFVVRPGHGAPTATGLSAPADILTGSDVGEQFCNALQCVVFTSAPGHIAALKSLQSHALVTLEPLPDARKIYFANSLYDADTDAFEADFPGRTETTPLLANALFAVVFKAWPERAWIDALEKAGLQPVAPMQSMVWLVYGPRSAISQLPKRFSTIYKTTDLPAGLKRFNLDTREEGDDDGPQWTYVHVVAAASETVAGLLRSRGGAEPGIIDRTPTVISYTSLLTRQEAIDFASFPEVLSVRRMSLHFGPADERSNRIVGGTFATPNTTYTQSFLPLNAPDPNYHSLYYSDSFLRHLFDIGIHPENQLIGLLDTGVDAGRQENGANYCPPFLGTPTNCRLVFTADTTFDDGAANTRGDDYMSHGTLVASILAGDAGPRTPGFDLDHYNFTQGIAGPNTQGTTQGARLAVSKFWRSCHNFQGWRTIHGRYLGETASRLTYSLVELSTNSSLPDYPNVNGPGVTLFNHSWARDDPPSSDYEETAAILDRSTRALNAYTFTYENGAVVSGGPAPPLSPQALHVVAADNDLPACDPPYQAGSVSAPGTAKNVITVGATESYNQQPYTSTCSCMRPSDADDQRQVALFSRTGWIYNRAKPDLVAPGTRSYGSSTTAADPCPTCNGNLTNVQVPGQPKYQWNTGTSFAAPVVSGSAALVRDWLRTLNFTDPSPALTKAVLLTATKNLAPCNSGCTNPPPSCTTCSYCGTTLPRPDRHQGWGGLALNELFRPATNYFFQDQQQNVPVFIHNGDYWWRTLSVVDYTLPIEITLVWTDPATIPNVPGFQGVLVNDLDLRLDIPGPGGAPVFTGDFYYSCINCCDRRGFSLAQYGTLNFDHKNNVERISLPAYTFAANGTQFTVRVTATSLQGDGINPAGNTRQQDFAIAVSNAH